MGPACTQLLRHEIERPSVTRWLQDILESSRYGLVLAKPMATYTEDRVLQPLDPPPADVNAWPDFALTEVKIFYQGTGKYADLLEASEDVPLCVLGELAPLDEEQQERGQ